MASRVTPELASPRFSDAWPMWDKGRAVNRDQWLPIRYEYAALEYWQAGSHVAIRLPAETLRVTGTTDTRERRYPGLTDASTCEEIYQYACEYWHTNK